MTVRVLVVGCGNMGSSHARAYSAMADFKLVGLVSRGAATREQLAAELGGGVPTFADFAQALHATKPDAVSINTYPDTHAALARQSLAAGCHVFLEKPLAESVEQATALVAQAQRARRKLLVGYILRVHPAWTKFVELARTLGKPLVMRMNLNQQSKGSAWRTHQSLMASMSPIVDCGVHYVDVMCQMTRSRPVRVHAIGARLTDQLPPGMYNWGQLQVTFADGSVGWYEAGWGPMISEVAYFVKDVIGPNGCVSIVERTASADAPGSDSVSSHTKTNSLRLHRAALDAEGELLHADQTFDTSDEPDHDALCRREQEFFLRAIREDLDLTEHLEDAVQSLRIVLAADRSVRTGEVVTL